MLRASRAVIMELLAIFSGSEYARCIRAPILFISADPIPLGNLQACPHNYVNMTDVNVRQWLRLST
jgi:hypothetical protein